MIRANPEEYRTRYGSILVSARELPQYVLDIPTPSDLTLAANYTPPNPFYELEGDLNAFQLFNLDSVGLGEYRYVIPIKSIPTLKPTKTTKFQDRTCNDWVYCQTTRINTSRRFPIRRWPNLFQSTTPAQQRPHQLPTESRPPLAHHSSLKWSPKQPHRISFKSPNNRQV